MPTCPICLTPLETTRQREGLFYPCPVCDGRAMTLPQIRNVLGDRVASKLLRLIKLTRLQSEHPCPFCKETMLVVSTQEPSLELEACRACNVVWFDRPTYESVPQMTVETTSSRPMQTTEIVALNRLQELKVRMAEEREEARKKKRLRRSSDMRKDGGPNG